MKENNINKVDQDLTEFLKSTQHWSKFETLSIVEGVLRAVIKMIYCIAPDKKTAKNTILAVLDIIDNY